MNQRTLFALWVLLSACHGGDRAAQSTTPARVAVNEPAPQAPTQQAPAPQTPPPQTATNADPTAPVAVTPAITAPATPVAQPIAPTGPRFLQLSWAQQQAKTPDAASKQASALRKEGLARYKAKDDASAVTKYEAALDLHASGQLYYDYANSLSNVDRLPDSVQAYTIAVALGYEHPEIALYNTACAYSRMQNADAAYATLRDAVAHGYYAFARLEQDTDLAFLRARDDFAAHLAQLQQDPSMLTGLIGKIDVRDDIIYTVCPSGQVIDSSPDGLDESCCGSTQRGELIKKGANVVIQWNERCGSNGSGGRKDKENEFEGCQPYVSCQPEQCKEIDYREEVTSIAELAEFASTPRSDGADDGALYHERFKGGVPAECTQQAAAVQ